MFDDYLDDNCFDYDYFDDYYEDYDYQDYEDDAPDPLLEYEYPYPDDDDALLDNDYDRFDFGGEA